MFRFIGTGHEWHHPAFLVDDAALSFAIQYFIDNTHALLEELHRKETRNMKTMVVISHPTVRPRLASATLKRGRGCKSVRHLMKGVELTHLENRMKKKL